MTVGFEVLDLFFGVDDGLHGDGGAVVLDLVNLLILDVRDLLRDKLVGLE